MVDLWPLGGLAEYDLKPVNEMTQVDWLNVD